jgi:chorismate synthase
MKSSRHSDFSRPRLLAKVFRMLQFETAGESHGECPVATLTRLPAGIPVSIDAVNHELWHRQQGYGCGGRMKIETDRAEIVASVRHSKTIGSPIAIIIRNADWQKKGKSNAAGCRR